MSNTQPVNLIRFHGLTLLVVEHEGVEYVPLKPLSDLAGIDWRTIKKSMEQPDNAKLYAAKWLKPPVFAAQGGDIPPTPDTLYIRLDRARLYLARISTARMKAHGNVDAAEMLLALQIEWAEVLHQYETRGVAIKQANKEARAELIALLKARGMPPSVQERQALTRLIHEGLAALGQPVPQDPQKELPGV
jgi:hypothetical protein